MSSGIRGRTERQKRHYKKHLEEGLCKYCSDKRSEGNKNFCDYHRGYLAGWNAARRIVLKKCDEVEA